MQLIHIKSDVYQLLPTSEYFTEKELLRICYEHDIADLQKTPIGWVVNHDKGIIPFKRYLTLISESACELIYKVIKTKIYENY
jgi:hypothetical protein